LVHLAASIGTGTQLPLLVLSRLYWYSAASIGTQPPLLVQAASIGTLAASIGTVKVGKSEHIKMFRDILKIFRYRFSLFLLQKSWYQKFYFPFHFRVESTIVLLEVRCSDLPHMLLNPNSTIFMLIKTTFFIL
jgi:hypothetical protein